MHANGHAMEKPASGKQQKRQSPPKQVAQQQQQQQQQRPANPQAAQMIRESMDPFFADVSEVKVSVRLCCASLSAMSDKCV